MLGHERHRDRLTCLGERRVLLGNFDRPVKDHLVDPTRLNGFEPCPLEDLFKDARHTDKYSWLNLFQIIRHLFYRLGVVDTHSVPNVNIHPRPLKNVRQRQHR